MTIEGYYRGAVSKVDIICLDATTAYGFFGMLHIEFERVEKVTAISKDVKTYGPYPGQRSRQRCRRISG